MKKIILYIILVIWMAIIFMFSNQQKEESTGLSNKIIDSGITIVEKLNNTKIDNKTRKMIYKYSAYPIRKAAHITIYFILGIIICNVFSLYNVNLKKLLLMCILFCFIYATTDEIHQLFTYGRNSSLLDVLIDTCGGILGILFSYRFIYGKKCKKIV